MCGSRVSCAGYAMMQPLPVGGFRWLRDDEFGLDMLQGERLQTIPANAPIGYILEVDLDYPAGLHPTHNDFPLAPEKLEVTADMLSSYCRSFGLKQIKCQKLIPNLQNKVKYVLHYRTLQLYTKLGLVVTKVHRVLSFSQTAWMASYIQLNTHMRQAATSEFEKNFYKLANNSVYGDYKFFTFLCLNLVRFFITQILTFIE